jgi:hypothetical protein
MALATERILIILFLSLVRMTDDRELAPGSRACQPICAL